jgi:hypothetical protein
MFRVKMVFPTSLSERTLAIGNLVAFAINTLITFSSNAPIYGRTNSQVSNMCTPLILLPRVSVPSLTSYRFETLLTPQGWAFSIWGAWRC